MRSRSSRLFIVLLHLVGVSTNLPAKLWDWNVGIVGVHPVAILLERLELESAGGLDGLLRRLRGAGYDVEGLLEEPYWLQDDADGKCMGPEGFSECGDATLWLVRRRPSRGQKKKKKRRRKHGGVFSSWLRNKEDVAAEDDDDDDDDGDVSWSYALQLIDVNLLSSSSSSSSSSSVSSLSDASSKDEAWGRMRPWDRSRRAEAECLVAGGNGPGRRRSRKDGKRDKNGREPLRLVPCGSDDAWGWHMDGDGVLVQESQGAADSRRGGKDKGRSTLMGVYGTVDPALGKNGRGANSRCLRRSDSASEVAPCFDEGESESKSPSSSNATDEGSGGAPRRSRVVRFSLIRYQAGAGAAGKLPKFSSDALPPPSQKGSAAAVESETKRSKQEPKPGARATPPEEEEESHLPHTTRTSHSHASGPMMHPELKPSSQLLFTNVAKSGTHPPKKIPEKGRRELPTGIGAQERMKPGGGMPLPKTGSGAASGPARPGHDRDSSKKKNLLHHPHASKVKVGGSSSSSSRPSLQRQDDAPHKPRKIPVHPYIAKQKRPGVWEDPQTGLEYPTDLGGYLGHDRRTMGRHTLMGVGLYTRTVFNIKVYGCAFYATKRDVLADPGYAPFAAMSVEELQNNDDFYEHLMSPPPPPEEGAGVDRTIFLKMNMQLATETMRTSLDADWSLMSSEHKDALISSSFKEREADERMLQKIKSEENSSRCSCGQLAPPEYEADPECCARGTELVFTWKKTGRLELRIDGRVMDSFEDPGLGKAIFYEYLRGDEPMSVDARDHFADGFPFLLAPLAQVRGVSSPVRGGPQEGPPPGSASPEEGGPGFLRFLGNAAGAVGSQAAAAAGWVQGGAEGAMNNVGKAARAVGESSRNLGAEMDRRRSGMVENVMSLPGQGAQLVTSLLPFGKARRGGEKVFQLRVLKSDGSTTGWDNVSNQSLQNILSGPIVQGLGPNANRGNEDAAGAPMSDEIGVIKSPTMNFTHQLFLYTVHLYLMLLLIVSVPGTYTTRLVVKRGGSSRGSSDEDSILCASPVERRRMKSPGSRPGRLRGIEVAVQLRIPSLEDNDQERVRHSQGAKAPQAADRGGGEEEAGRRRDPSQLVPPPEQTEMKKAFSYFL